MDMPSRAAMAAWWIGRCAALAGALSTVACGDDGTAGSGGGDGSGGAASTSAGTGGDDGPGAVVEVAQHPADYIHQIGVDDSALYAVGSATFIGLATSDLIAFREDGSSTTFAKSGPADPLTAVIQLVVAPDTVWLLFETDGSGAVLLACPKEAAACDPDRAIALGNQSLFAIEDGVLFYTNWLIDSTVYFVNCYDLEEAGRCPADGTLYVSPEGVVSQPQGLAVSGGDVFVLGGDVDEAHVVRIPAAGGASVVPLGHPPSPAFGFDNATLLIDGGALYGAVGDGVVALDLASGGVSVVAAEADGAVAIALTEGHVAWATGTGLGGGPGAIRAIARGGGDVVTLAEGETGPRSLVADATAVYWVEADANVVKSVVP